MRVGPALCEMDCIQLLSEADRTKRLESGLGHAEVVVLSFGENRTPWSPRSVRGIMRPEEHSGTPGSAGVCLLSMPGLLRVAACGSCAAVLHDDFHSIIWQFRTSAQSPLTVGASFHSSTFSNPQ